MPQCILFSEEYGRGLPKKRRLIRPLVQARRAKLKRETEAAVRPVDLQPQEGTHPIFTRKHAANFMEKGTGVADAMYPPHVVVGAAEAFGIGAELLRPPVVNGTTPIDPKSALRLKWSEGKGRPATEPLRPQRPSDVDEGHRDIFGNLRVERAAAPLAQRSPTTRDPITLLPKSHVPTSPRLAHTLRGTPAGYDIFGNPKVTVQQPRSLRCTSQIAQQEPPMLRAETKKTTSISDPPVLGIHQIGQRSLQEHYAKVMRCITREHAAISTSAASRHVDPTHTVATQNAQQRHFDIFGGPVLTAKVDYHGYKKPADLGGVGVPLGGVGVPLGGDKMDKHRPASDPVVAPFTVVPDVTSPTATKAEAPFATATTSVRPKTTTVLRTSSQQPSSSNDPGSVLRSSAMYRSLLKQSKGWGVRPVRVELRDRDKKATGIISLLDLRNAMAAVGVELSDGDVEMLRRAGWAPAVGDGRILIAQLMEALRGPPPSARREAAMRAAFRQVCPEGCTADSDGIGAATAPGVSPRDLSSRLDPRGHVAYNAHDRGSAALIQRAFSQLWGPEFPADQPRITLAHFVGFFRDVSPSVPSDAAFINMMRDMFPRTTK